LKRVKLWDLPTRLVHLSFILLLPGLWWTWRSGDTQLHEKLGYVTLGVLMFRLYWGVAGSSTARFSRFVKGPRAIAAYLRGGSPASVGHNPLGALSVIVLLGLIFAEVTFGLFAQDIDGLESGPLARYVSYETAEWARGWHALLFNMILALVVVHVLAILFYLLIKRDNLVGPMITGRKSFEGQVEQPWMASVGRALAGIMLAVFLTWWISKGLRF
jgi:cytochrome b